MRLGGKSSLAGITALALAGCMSMPQDGRNLVPTTTSLAYFPKKTQTQMLLNQLPPPQRPVAVAVYGFTDQTGQFRPSDVGQTLSRAVTQGASSMLVKALQDAGNRRWFTIVERERLDNLLRERQIISEMRKR
jgi:curli production assembly/transport component CsgG